MTATLFELPPSGFECQQRQMAIYAREGVAHLRLFDPDLKTLEAFELNEKRWTVIATHGGDEPAHVAPFDAFALELGALWV